MVVGAVLGIVVVALIAAAFLLAPRGGGEEEKETLPPTVEAPEESKEETVMSGPLPLTADAWEAEPTGTCDAEDECRRDYAVDGEIFFQYRGWDKDKDCAETGPDRFGYILTFQEPLRAKEVVVRGRVTGQVTAARGYGNARGFGWILGLRANGKETETVGLCLAGDYGLRVCAPTYRDGKDFPDADIVKRFSTVWEPGQIIVDLNLEINVYRKESGEWAYKVVLGDYEGEGVLTWPEESIERLALVSTGGACKNYMPIEYNVVVEQVVVK